MDLDITSSLQPIGTGNKRKFFSSGEGPAKDVRLKVQLLSVQGSVETATQTAEIVFCPNGGHNNNNISSNNGNCNGDSNFRNRLS